MTAIDLAKPKSGALFYILSHSLESIYLKTVWLSQSLTMSTPPPPHPPFTTEAFVILITDKSSLGMVASYEDVLSLATF